MEKKIPYAKIKLSNNLKVLRKNNEKSINAVAAEIKLTYSYLHALEDVNVIKNPSMEILDKLSAYYGVEVYELFL